MQLQHPEPMQPVHMSASVSLVRNRAASGQDSTAGQANASVVLRQQRSFSGMEQCAFHAVQPAQAQCMSYKWPAPGNKPQHEARRQQQLHGTLLTVWMVEGSGVHPECCVEHC